MGKKTFELQGQITLGEPELGTAAWSTEYDVEFSDKVGVDYSHVARPPTGPANVKTPRSLKKGFVHVSDYESLAGRSAAAEAAYRDLQLQLGTLEQRLSTLSTKEDEFVASVQHEHMSIQDVKSALMGLTDSLSSLVTNMERNKAFMGLLNSYKATPGLLDNQHRVTQTPVEEAVSTKVSAMEARMAEMAEAVTFLAAEQARQRREGGPGGQRAAGGQLPRQRPRSSHLVRPREKIDRLPAPRTSLLPLQDFWVPPGK